MSVEVERRKDVAIVRLNYPPVNAIGKALRQGLKDAFEQISQDASIARVVLTGANNIFAAGADAREFDQDPEEPHLPDVVRLIETCGVPCIAAIDGAALGGGCELTLACTYRISSPSTKIGLPEVTLGIVPGAGGTQRLPRLVGLPIALELISQGRVLDARKAFEVGLIDKISDDPVATALAIETQDLSGRIALADQAKPSMDQEAVTQAINVVKKKSRGQIAPIKAIELVCSAAELPFDDGMKKERNTFWELRQSAQARALRHMFFAERGAKIPKELARVSPVELHKVLVIGGGTMGSSIAYALNAANIPTHISETDEASVERANANVDKLFAGAVARGLLTQDAATEKQKSLTVGVGYIGDTDADLAIEAAVEDIDVKKTIFSELASRLPQHAILASNTSYLDINLLADQLDDPTRVIGLHFFSPAHIMKLLEIVQGERTSDVALATAYFLSKNLRKIPVLAGVCDGFIGNRILARYREIADVTLIDGSLPWEIDDAMMEFGYAMGPYAAQDLSGLDIAYANRKRLAPTRNPKRRYVTISDRMVEEGRLGRKASVGWYRYPGGGGAVLDPLLEDLIVEEAYFAKVSRREFTSEEIRNRLLAAMVNEACDILDEGIAQTAADIDLVLVHGYGFPRWRGGLMHYAETVGFGSILKNVRMYAEEDPVLWTVSPRLIALADNESTTA